MKLKPKTPNYYLMPFNDSLSEQYNDFYSIKDIFSKNTVGIVTARDKVVIAIEKKELQDNLKFIFNKDISDQEIRNKFKLKDTRGWKLPEIRKKGTNIKFNKFIQDISYRPFDNRKIIYHSDLIDWDRKTVMKHMLAGENIGLLVSRSGTGLTEWREVQITNKITELGIMSTRPGNGTPIFPLYLYLYPDDDLLSKKGAKNKNRVENFAPEFRKTIDGLYKKHYSPEEIMGYIYGVLHSEFYRTKYLQYLKMDFPRVPFTKSKKLFEKLSKLGTELIDAHLMKNIPSAKIGDYIGKGNDEVLKPKYDAKTKRVYINENQYFDKVDKEIWEFYIGGYQVIDKYLKSRKGRKLSSDEINNVGNIVKVLNFTIKQMKNIDEIYIEVDKEFYE